MSEAKRSYYRLFLAYLLASLATGVAVVCLSLLAFELTGDEQGAAAVIGAALSIKTLAYVAGAPLVAAFLGAAPRRPLMIGLDLVRAGALLLLPFATAVWHLYALIGVFTLANAAFTPAYQASVPGLLPDPADYAKSLSRSRLAGELEGVVSPLIAAALLTALSVRGVFVATMVAFLLSAALIARVRLTDCPPPGRRPLQMLGRGFGALFGPTRLRGLAPMALAAGAGAAVVMVETVPLVRGRFGLGAEEAAVALAAYGAGAVAGALALPMLLQAFGPRRLMLAGGALTALALGVALAIDRFETLLALWAAIGAATALAQSPALALIREATAPEEQQAVYAANFALSTAAAGICYAAAGAIGSSSTLSGATGVLAVVAALATLVAALRWREGQEGRSARP
jgi:MFS family permease